MCLSLNFGARILPQIVASRNFSMLRLASVFPTKYSWANDSMVEILSPVKALWRVLWMFEIQRNAGLLQRNMLIFINLFILRRLSH